MNDFTRIISRNYDFHNHTINDTKRNLSQKSKKLVLSCDNYKSYMRLYNKVTKRKRMFLPKIPISKNAVETSYLSSNQCTLTEMNFAPYENIISLKKRNNIYSRIIQSNKRKQLKLNIVTKNKSFYQLNSNNIYNNNINIEQIGLENYLKEHLSILNDDLAQTKSTEFQTEQSNNNGENVELIFKSISIEIKEKTDDIKQSTSKVYIFPFEFLPFFYSLTIEDFLLFISDILNPIETIELFTIDIDLVKRKINEYKEKFPLLSSEANLFKICDKKDNELQYEWIVQNKIFQLKINLPIFECFISNIKNKNKLHFMQIPSNQTILKILIGSFDQWDQIVFSTFNSYTLFRKMLSSINNSRLSINENVYMLNNLQKKKKNFSSYIEYFISFKNKTLYVKLYSFQFNIKFPFPKIKKNLYKEYESDKEDESLYKYKNFTVLSKLYEVNKLNSFMKRFNLNEFIEMCIKVNYMNESIEINKDIYDSLEEKIFPIGREGKQREKKDKKNNIVYTVTPRLEWRERGNRDSIEEGSKEKYQLRTFCLANEIVDKLGNVEIDKWSQVIKESIKELEKEFVGDSNKIEDNQLDDIIDIDTRENE